MKKGHQVMNYLNYFFLMGYTFEECKDVVIDKPFQEKRAIARERARAHSRAKAFRSVINYTSTSNLLLHVLLFNCLCLIKICLCSRDYTYGSKYFDSESY